MRVMTAKNTLFAILCTIFIYSASPYLLAGESDSEQGSSAANSETSISPIPYIVQGNGKSTVVFIHGFMDVGNVWDSVIREMHTKDYRFATLDLPFMGGLSGMQSDISLDRLADAVTGVVDDLDVQVVLVGQSMGAQVAELVACSRPNAVKGMVLIAPVPLSGLPVPEQFITAMLASAKNEELQRKSRMEAFPNLDRRKIDMLVHNGMQVLPENMAALIETWSNGHPAGKFSGSDAIPVLIIDGENDPVCNPEVLKLLVAPRFSKQETKILPNASHWPHIEHPDKIAVEVDKFLNETINRGKITTQSEDGIFD